MVLNDDINGKCQITGVKADYSYSWGGVAGEGSRGEELELEELWGSSIATHCP